MKIQTTKIFSKVDKAVNDGYSVISAQGSSRSSKTYNILIWLIVYLLKHPNTRLSIVRKTLPALKKSVLQDLKEILIEKFDLWSDGSFNKTELIYTLPNGSWIEMFSVDDEQKIRGSKRHILYVNEGNEINFTEWTQLEMRTTKLSIIDYNPSYSEDHWLNQLNLDEKTYHFISTYKDNPFLEQKVIDSIEGLKTKNQSLWRIYGLGLRSQVEGLIFKTIHEIDEIPYWVKKRYLGLDFGYSQDPTACTLVGVHEDNLYIDEQFYLTEMLTSDIIRELKNLERLKVISESADPRLIKEISNAGINIHAVVKGQGSISAGLTKMQGYNIHITKSSANVLKEFRNYTYAQNREGKFLNEPIDDYNHAIDGIRYVVLTELLGNNKRSLSTKSILGI